MGGIFISYRRDDTEGHAGRLFDALAARFGKQSVFMDVEAIRPGEDFTDVIEQVIGACDVVLGLIGKRWLNVTDAAGARRLDNKDDLVRRELEFAQARGVTLIPVLLHGAQMPSALELPASLAAIPQLNAYEIRHNKWDVDVELLLQKLALELDAAPVPAQVASSNSAPAARSGWLGGVLGSSARAGKARFSARVWLLCVAALLALYLLVLFVFELSEEVLFAGWIVIGAAFGLWHVLKRGTRLGRDLALAAGIAATAALAMLASTSAIDHVPFWPQNWDEWRGTLVHVALIALSYLGGSLLGRNQKLRALLR